MTRATVKVGCCGGGGDIIVGVLLVVLVDRAGFCGSVGGSIDEFVD